MQIVTIRYARKALLQRRQGRRHQVTVGLGVNQTMLALHDGHEGAPLLAGALVQFSSLQFEAEEALELGAVVFPDICGKTFFKPVDYWNNVLVLVQPLQVAAAYDYPRTDKLAPRTLPLRGFAESPDVRLLELRAQAFYGGVDLSHRAPGHHIAVLDRLAKDARGVLRSFDCQALLRRPVVCHLSCQGRVSAKIAHHDGGSVALECRVPGSA